MADPTATKSELYAEARDAGVEGRSKMSNARQHHAGNEASAAVEASQFGSHVAPQQHHQDQRRNPHHMEEQSDERKDDDQGQKRELLEPSRSLLADSTISWLRTPVSAAPWSEPLPRIPARRVGSPVRSLPTVVERILQFALAHLRPPIDPFGLRLLIEIPLRLPWSGPGAQAPGGARYRCGRRAAKTQGPRTRRPGEGGARVHSVGCGPAGRGSGSACERAAVALLVDWSARRGQPTDVCSTVFRYAVSCGWSLLSLSSCRATPASRYERRDARLVAPTFEQHVAVVALRDIPVRPAVHTTAAGVATTRSRPLPPSPALRAGSGRRHATVW